MTGPAHDGGTNAGAVPAGTLSLAPELRGRAQPVAVWLRGAAYPGEAIVADRWQDSWGAPLRGRAMFRVVLLTQPQRVMADVLQDNRIAVAIPRASPPEARVRDLEKESHALRETRARYAYASDAGLRSLTHAMRGRIAEIERRLAGALREAWARGTVLVADGGDDGPAGGLADAFIGEAPGVWIDGLAGGLLLARYSRRGRLQVETDVPLTPQRQADVHKWLCDAGGLPGDVAALHARALGLADPNGPAGFDLSGCEPVAAIDELLEEAGGVLPGEELRQLLVHERGVPPDIAALYLLACVRGRDSELCLRPDVAPAGDDGLPAGGRIIRDVLPDVPPLPELLEMTEELRARVSHDWNTALPYLRLVMPAAACSARAGGGPPQAGAFMDALETLEARLTLAAGVMSRLEETLGPGAGVSASGQDRVLGVMASESWEEFFVSARSTFGSVRAFRSALTAALQTRRIAEIALEIERCARYLDEASFGRRDAALSLSASALRARLDLRELLRNPALWPPLQEQCARWRLDFRRAYIEAHNGAQTKAREMARRVRAAALQVRTLRGFARLPELGPPPDDDLFSRWDELAAGFAVCSVREDGLTLRERPYCSQCGMPLGSPATHADLEAVMDEVADTLRAYNARLSSAAVRRVLEGSRKRDTAKLLMLNAAADLSALSGVLDDDVIAFLRRFLAGDGPHGPTGGQTCA